MGDVPRNLTPREPEETSYRVCMVCTGNICRSPMAHAVMRHKIARAGLSKRIHVASAGTYDGHQGERPHKGTQRELAQRGIAHDDLRSRPLTADDIESADYLIVMDLENYEEVSRLAREWGFEPLEDLRLLLEFAERGEEGDDLDLPDPWYTRRFNETYAMVDDATTGLLKYIRQKEGL